VDDYLKNRTSLCCVFALLDSGLPPQEIDVRFISWLARNSVPFVLVFTKTDKVTPATVQANIAAFTARISGWFEKLPAIFTCSAVAKQGRVELLGVIDEMMTAIEAESASAPQEATIPPEDMAATNQKMSPPSARKKRPDLARPW
jgi:GTP-binding protein EngB required for normal cell division